MASIQEIAARTNRQAVNGLLRNLRAMPAEKLSWKPLDRGRDALDQAKEVAVINLIGAGILRDRAMPEDFRAEYGRLAGLANTPEEILALLEKSGAALAEAILAFPEDALDDTLTMPWDTEPSMFGELFLMPYWNTAYHIGQVAYIQTLYGDREMH